MKFANNFGSTEFKENLMEFKSNSKIVNVQNWLPRRNPISQIPYRDIKSVEIRKATVFQWLFYGLSVLLLIQGFVSRTEEVYDGGDNKVVYQERATTMQDHIIGIVLFLIFITIGVWYSNQDIAKAKAVKVKFYDGKRNSAFVYASQKQEELEEVKKEVLSKISTF